jgi:hypothetical protein
MRKKKLGNPQGVSEWQTLATAADVRRFLRWCILSVRAQTLDAKVAATLGQLGCYLVKTIEVGDIESRLEALEAAREESTHARGVIPSHSEGALSQ